MKGPSAAKPDESSPISWIRLFRWARQAIAGLLGPFFLITFIGLASAWMVQYNLQVVTNLIGSAGNAAQTQAEAPAPSQPDTPDGAAPQDAGADSQTGGKSASNKSGGGVNFIDAIVPHEVVPSAIMLAITGVLVIALAFANRVGTVWLNTLMLRRLQLRLHDKLLQLGPSYHRDHDLGEKQTIVTMYAQNAQPMLRDVLAFPIVRLGSLASALLLLFHNLNKLRAEGQGSMVYTVLAVLLIILPIGGWYLSVRLRRASKEVRDRQAVISSTLVDSLTAPQEVQMMDAGGRRSAAFAVRLRELAAAQVQAAMRNETSVQFQAAVPELLRIGLVLWAVFIFGRDNPSAAIQSIVGIYFFVPLVVQPIQEIIQFYSMLNASWPNIEKVGQTLEEPLEVEDKGTRTVDGLKGYDIEIKDVTYRPLPDLTVVDHVDLSVPNDKVTALIGEAGSGKSTIMKMVARLFDPNEGRVLIGGVPVEELKLSSLRSLIGTVSQFPLYLEGDARQNLRLAKPDATDAEMEAACRSADVWAALEKGSPSDPLALRVPRNASEGGPSGGERRRLAIARALLTDPKILLLDEPSTGIDALSVKKIAEELRRVAQGRTVLLIDHNMDLVEALSDTVCCLEGGRITDIGAPKELAARPTLFKRLLDAQRTYGGKAEFEVEATVPVRKVDVPGGGGKDGAKGAARKGDGPPPGPGGPTPDKPLKAGRGMAMLVED